MFGPERDLEDSGRIETMLVMSFFQNDAGAAGRRSRWCQTLAPDWPHFRLDLMSNGNGILGPANQNRWWRGTSSRLLYSF